MATSAPGKHCKNRLFEWTMTVALLSIGIELLIWPGSIAASKLQFMLDVLGSNTLTIFYLLVGWFRGIALYLNGGWPVWGARVRTFCAIGGSLVWLQMGISLIIAQLALGAPPSPSVPIFLALAAAELYSTYRAAADARFR